MSALSYFFFQGGEFLVTPLMGGGLGAAITMNGFM